MNQQNSIQRHLGNISRQVGHDISNRYSYIVSSDDLTNAYIQMRNDLGYPLMMDSKYRRAIVYNKEGLEKKISTIINECILSNIKTLEKMIVDDIVNDVTTQLNSLTQTANGTIMPSKSNSKSFTNMFASAMAKSLVNSISNLINEITNPKEYRK